MPPEFLSLLGQVPLVGIFVVFVWIWSDRNQKSIDKRDEANQKSMNERDKAMREFFAEQRVSDREVMASLIKQVEGMSSALSDHDRKTDNAITLMEERTSGKPKTRPR